MTLEGIYYISEIVAVVAVIASLLYVGRQIRQNTEATQTAAAQAYVSADNDIVGLINSSDKLAEILYRGANGISELNGADLIQFMAFNEQVFISFQSFFLQWRKGILDERLWHTYRQAALEVLAQPGQQQFWSARRHWFYPEFRDYLEAALESESVEPMHFSAFSK